MPDLTFRVANVSPMRYAPVPMLAVRLAISNASATEPIHSVLLNCQVRIEPLGRKYTAEEEARLLDLFGERERWARTMKPMLWTQAALNVPGFSGATEAELALPCTLGFRCGCDQVFLRTARGRHSDLDPVQRHGVLCGSRWRAAGGADSLGPRSALSFARNGMAGGGGNALSQHHLDAAAAGDIRPPLPIQDEAQPAHVGAGD